MELQLGLLLRQESQCLRNRPPPFLRVFRRGVEVDFFDFGSFSFSNLYALEIYFFTMYV